MPTNMVYYKHFNKINDTVTDRLYFLYLGHPHYSSKESLYEEIDVSFFAKHTTATWIQFGPCFESVRLTYKVASMIPNCTKLTYLFDQISFGATINDTPAIVMGDEFFKYKSQNVKVLEIVYDDPTCSWTCDNVEPRLEAILKYGTVCLPNLECAYVHVENAAKVDNSLLEIFASSLSLYLPKHIVKKEANVVRFDEDLRVLIGSDRYEIDEQVAFTRAYWGRENLFATQQSSDTPVEDKI